MTEPDRVGAALWSILAGSSAGAAANAAALLLFDRTVNTLPFLFGGGLAAGVVVGLLVSRKIDDAWRRAITGAICAFGTVLLMLGTIVIDVSAQALGIAMYGVVLTLVAAFAGYRALR